MAGVKGRSGGARPNSGGARPGSGPKPKPRQLPVLIGNMDMLQMLQAVALGQVDATPLQVRAAITAVQYTHVKRGDGGLKDEADAKARAAAAKGGRYAALVTPIALATRYRAKADPAPASPADDAEPTTR